MQTVNFFNNSIKFDSSFSFDELFELSKEKSLVIKDNISLVRTSSNIVESLERLFFEYDQCVQMMSSMYNLNQKEEWSEKLQETSKTKIELMSELTANISILDKLKSLPREKLVDDWIFAFKIAGCGLSETDKKEFDYVEYEISCLEIKYEAAIAKEQYKTFAIDRDDVSGIPESVLKDAVQKNNFYLFNENHTHEILQYAHNSEVRRKAYEYSNTVGKTEDIENIILKINSLRQKKAELLGYDSYLDYSLEQKMIANRNNLNNKLEPLEQTIKTLVDKKNKEIEDFALSQSCEHLKSYDWAYYQNLFLKKKYNISELEIKKNFKVKEVVPAILNLIKEKFGLTFKENTKFRKGVLFDTFYNHEYRGQVFLDLYAREDKMAGAWMDTFLNGGFGQSPILVLACNFNENDECIELDDVNTLLHEFGHIVHGLLNNSYYPSQNGTNVVEDFVEFPSQFFENFLYDQAFLKYLNLDIDLNKIFQYKNEFIAKWIMRQLYYIRLDYNFYDLKFNDFTEIKNMEKDLFVKIYGYHPQAENFHFIHSFGHLVDEGYSAGYFSYLLSSMMEKDAAIFLQDNPQNWPGLLGCFATKGKDEMRAFEDFKGSLNLNNYLKFFQLEEA